MCGFVRGGDVLVAVAVRGDEDAGAAVVADPPGGQWRDVLTGEERSFGPGARSRDVVDEHGIGVFERL